MLNAKNGIIKQLAICVLLLVLSYIIGFGQFDLIQGIKMVAIYIGYVLFFKLVFYMMHRRANMYQSDIYDPLFKYQKSGVEGISDVRFLFNAFFTLGIVGFSIALVFNLIDSITDWRFDRVNTIFFVVLELNGFLYFKHEFLSFIDKIIEEEKL